jgi:cardiolipin synthase (CMP-forming)
MQTRIFSVPNQLTLIRLGFLPFLIIAIHYDRYDWALGILIAAGLSDGLDGLLARVLNQRTPLGAYLDPIADKLLLSSCYLVLALKGKIAWWLTIMVLGRDVLILVSCAVILAAIGSMSFPPSIWGKAATTVEILLVLLVIVLQLTVSQPLSLARQICTYLVAALVLISGFHYAIDGSKRLHAQP